MCISIATVYQHVLFIYIIGKERSDYGEDEAEVRRMRLRSLGEHQYQGMYGQGMPFGHQQYGPSYVVGN